MDDLIIDSLNFLITLNFIRIEANFVWKMKN